MKVYGGCGDVVDDGEDNLCDDVCVGGYAVV